MRQVDVVGRGGTDLSELMRPDGAVIHYQVTGDGYPVLALAPGGVSSGIDRWQHEPIRPADAFADEFMVIEMDQRYAGRSLAPLKPFTYAQALGDQLAVLDAVGAKHAHLVAADIGCAHALRLLYEAPARIASAVLLDPVGVDATNTMDAFYEVFNETIRVARAEGLEGVLGAAQNPALNSSSFIDNPAAGPWAQRLHDDPAFRDALASLGRETYIALVVDFRDGAWPWGQQCFSVNDVALERINAPLLVLPGSDLRHPTGLAQTICTEVPNARWLDVDARVETKLTGTLETIRGFLQANTQSG
jgi:pimeloyl-ACP methyl ester carboxylesterase